MARDGVVALLAVHVQDPPPQKKNRRENQLQNDRHQTQTKLYFFFSPVCVRFIFLGATISIPSKTKIIYSCESKFHLAQNSINKFPSSKAPFCSATQKSFPSCRCEKNNRTNARAREPCRTVAHFISRVVASNHPIPVDQMQN